jgi:hypothetical protein
MCPKRSEDIHGKEIIRKLSKQHKYDLLEVYSPGKYLIKLFQDYQAMGLYYGIGF